MPTEYFDLVVLHKHIFFTDIASSYLKNRIRVDQTVLDDQQTDKSARAATFSIDAKGERGSDTLWLHVTGKFDSFLFLMNDYCNKN